MAQPAPTTGPTSGPLLSRLAAALFLRRDFYARAAADATATGPAGAIVALSALIRESVVIYEIGQVWPAWAWVLPILAVVALVAWVLLAAVAWLLTRPLADPRPDLRRLLRCLGFAQAPTMLLSTLAAATDARLYLVAFVAVLAWAYAAVVVALRAAADTTTGRACLLALPVFLAEFVLLLLSRAALLG